MLKKIIAALLSVLCITGALLLPGCQEQGIPNTDPSTSVESTLSTQGTTLTSTTVPSTLPSIPTTLPSTLPPVTTAPPTTAPTLPPVTESVDPNLPAWLQPGYALQTPYGFVYDGVSGQMLHQTADQDTRVYPASLTKLFTAYVALQYLAEDTVITAGEEVTYIHPESSRAYIQPGHRLTVSMLVEGMMLPSGNDAAYVIAAATGYVLADQAAVTPLEAIDLFMQEVNAQAQALGLTGTHFSTPDGIHQDDHYTTPRDLLAIAQLAMAVPIIRQYAATVSDSVKYESGQWASWNNTNALINPGSEYYCPEAVGLKTGSEDLAGYCLIAAFPTEGGYRYVLVLKSATGKTRFADALWLYHNFAK